jgi:putative glycosyltransferase (TIGR04372 family)
LPCYANGLRKGASGEIAPNANQLIMRDSSFFRSQQPVFDQFRKTIDRPSRLITGPLIRCVRVLIGYHLALWVLIRALPEGLVKILGLSSLYLAAGQELFQRDRPKEAWLFMERYLRIARPSIDEYLLGAMCLYHGLGRFRSAMALLASANEKDFAETENLALANTRYRVLDRIWARHIGHTATIDYVIKLGMLEGRAKEDTILYVPRGSPIANRFLLQQVATQLRLIESTADLPFDASAVQALHYDYLGPRLPDGSTAYFWEIAAKTYKRWEKEDRGPLLRLPPEIEVRGWATLREAGVPQGAWFVTLHVREGKWDGRNAGMHGVMNADISNYLPAISEVTRRGGWVVRMGDPGMRLLPPLANVIDYCHCDFRADWMDVFLAARCRFMVGSTSGPAFIPPLYGAPLLLTNWWPPAQRPLHSSDIFVPKLLRSLINERYLTLSESLREPFSYCHSRSYLAEHGKAYVEDCDPLVLAGAVEEMLARSEGNMDCSAEVADLRARADQIYQAEGAFGGGQFAAAFLRRHADIIA